MILILILIPPSSSYPLHRVQDIGDHPRFPGTREWVAPSAPPTDWLQLANQPQTEAEVAALRCCVNRGRPVGDPNWVTDTAERLGSNARFGPVEDRRNNCRLATFTCTLCVLQIWWLSSFTSTDSGIRAKRCSDTGISAAVD